MNIYIGNLSRQTTEDDLRQAFEAFGQVESVNIVKDRLSGESRGFGFVSMSAKDEAQKAVEEMTGKDFMGHTINVEEGRPKVNRYPMGGRGRRGGSDGRERRNGFDGGRGGRRY